MFLLHLCRVLCGARKANDHVVAQSEASMIPAFRHDRCNGQVRPLRELRAHESGYERRIDHHRQRVPGDVMRSGKYVQPMFLDDAQELRDD